MVGAGTGSPSEKMDSVGQDLCLKGGAMATVEDAGTGEARDRADRRTPLPLPLGAQGSSAELYAAHTQSLGKKMQLDLQMSLILSKIHLDVDVVQKDVIRVHMHYYSVISSRDLKCNVSICNRIS
jgi:hypothetical protein